MRVLLTGKNSKNAVTPPKFVASVVSWLLSKSKYFRVLLTLRALPKAYADCIPRLFPSSSSFLRVVLVSRIFAISFPSAS